MSMQEIISDNADLYEALNNIKMIVSFLGHATELELSENAKHGAYLCFLYAEELLDRSLEHVDKIS